ncbi:MAG TPA: formate dehydrogenase subunit gamma [Caulobacteraceae bacterium]|nr:formate dehydrogenase subunit gamma [Caulobacteraceae bacterium]
MAQAWDPDVAERLIAEHLALDAPMLPILHALQDTFGCVPPDVVPLIAEALNLSRAEVHGVVSFYHDFRGAPAGRRVVRVCRAESCQAMGGEAAAAFLLAALGVEWGGTTADGEVTVEPVYCLGLCAVSPAALVDGEPVGRVDGMSLVEAVRG